MKEYKYKINGNLYNVVIGDIEDNIAHVEVNGTHYTVEMEKKPKAAPAPKPVARPVAKPAAAPVAAPAPVAAAGAKDVVAPMPGTIKDVKVKVGDAVKNGQLVCIMEAMKMDMEVFASADGTVAEVCLAGGSSVQKGQAIVKLA